MRIALPGDAGYDAGTPIADDGQVDWSTFRTDGTTGFGREATA